MRVLWLIIAAMVCLPAEPPSRADPRATSIYPFSGQPGTTFIATLRGAGLVGATSVSADGAPLTIAVDGIEAEGKSDLVKLRVEVASSAKPGRYPIRLITPNGVSNSLPIHVVGFPVVSEPDGVHETQDSAIAIGTPPAIYAGRLSRRGETDYYAFQAQAGQTLTFEVVSGFPQIAATGSAATIPNFDPSLTIYSAEGSWFDPKRLKRIAYNDEPVWVFGKPTDAYMVHRFPTAGRYLLRIEAFAGQGGPDYSYQLKIAPGEEPQDLAPPVRSWDERTWTRRLEAGRLNQLAVRGGKPDAQKQIETYRGSPEAATFKIPGSIEGALARPGEVHRARFHLDRPADIAIEVETPAAAPPYFNPIVRLLNQAGEEVATNILAGRSACSGNMTKSAQAKTLVPLRDTGDYTLEIRDATADLAGADFRYRVQVRPQVPHVGQVRIDTDHLNLEPGQAKTVTVSFDREEGFRGAVTVATESLPPGVSAMAGSDFEAEKDTPPTTGKRERYTPRTERFVVVLSADAAAPASDLPRDVRLVVRPLVDGKQGEVLSTKSIPVMVVAKP